LLSNNNQNNNFWNTYASSLIILERYTEAKEVLQKALALNPQSATAKYNLACWYSIHREIDLALEYLKESIDSGYRYHWLNSAKDDPDFDNIRQDERFQALLNLPPESSLREE
jgi:tetratricopeptide (TPR) repeat protein